MNQRSLADGSRAQNRHRYRVHPSAEERLFAVDAGGVIWRVGDERRHFNTSFHIKSLHENRSSPASVRLTAAHFVLQPLLRFVRANGLLIQRIRAALQTIRPFKL